MKTNRKHIGVFGGTFNPPHRAHIEMALGVLRMLHLDEVLFIPTNHPPHKSVSDDVPARLRYEMVNLATAPYPALSVSDIEIARGGKSYTVDTLKALHKQYPNAAFTTIVGADMLKDLPNWKDAQTLFQLTGFIGIKRADPNGAALLQAQARLKELGANAAIADFEVPPISSTQVRDCVFCAKPITRFVVPDVEWMIYEHGLYMGKPFQRMQEKCRRMLNIKRYRHTVGVMLMAVALADAYGVNAREARLAALLHDCGRFLDGGALTHAIKSERMAREQFHIRNERVLQAIRYHTTLHKGANDLEKILYLADMIERHRDYPGVEELRKLAFEDLDGAACAGLWSTISYVRENGGEVHEDSLEAFYDLANHTQVYIP